MKKKTTRKNAKSKPAKRTRKAESIFKEIQELTPEERAKFEQLRVFELLRDGHSSLISGSLSPDDSLIIAVPNFETLEFRYGEVFIHIAGGVIPIFSTGHFYAMMKARIAGDDRWWNSPGGPKEKLKSYDNSHPERPGLNARVKELRGEQGSTENGIAGQVNSEGYRNRYGKTFTGKAIGEVCRRKGFKKKS